MNATPSMHWSAKYVGTPYQSLGRTATGCDCWGLVRLVYRGEMTIELSSYAGGYSDPDELREVNALVSAVRKDGPWIRLDGQDPREFDLLVFRRGRYDSHVGLVAAPGLMLHMEGEDCAKIVDYRAGRWAPRLEGLYRHEALS